MKEFFSYVIIIAVIALIGFICYMIWKKNETGAPGVVIPGLDKKGFNEQDPFDKKTTITFSDWSVVQLDPENGRPIKKMNLIIPSSGVFTIGRSKDCDFVLRDAKPEDGTSRLHLGVGKDKSGYFAKPISRQDGSLPMTYIDDVLINKSFDLDDKQVIWLGNTPIAFVRNISKRKNLKFNPGSVDNKRNTALFGRDYDASFEDDVIIAEVDTNTFTR